MDPITGGLINAGGLGLAVAILYVLHRDSLKAFREEMKSERERNDRNLEKFFDKLDKIAVAAVCRAPVNFIK